MSSKRNGRRRFLKDGAALAALAVGGARLAKGQTAGSGPGDARSKDLHAYGERSHFETSVRRGNQIYGKNPIPGEYYAGGPRTPIQDSVGIITPSSLHFIVGPHGSTQTPDINPQDHRLLIHGLVDHPLMLSMEDLKRLPSVTRVHYLECRANGAQSRVRKNPQATAQLTHGLTSCSEWTGVPVSLLLKEAGLKKEGTWIVAEGAEVGMHTKSVPIEKILDDCLVAYGQNGEAVRPDQGYPLRLIAPGWQGINNVKWLRRIKVVTQPYMGKAESTSYVEPRPDGKARWYTSELGPSSVITRPSGGQRMPGRGFYEVSGLAWSGTGSIRRVEVSTDGGKTWKDAQIQSAVHRKAHTRFGLAWNWNGEETVVQSRCTDDTGAVQPSVAEILKIWNLPGDYFQKFDEPTVSSSPIGIFGNFNAIQRWRVMADGSVQNALLS